MFDERAVVLNLYLKAAEIDPAVDRELLSLLKECEKRMEPIPDELKRWAVSYAKRSMAPARKGRPSEILRDINISTFVDMVRVAGYKKREVVELLCEILSMAEITIIKADQRGQEIRKQAAFCICYFQK